MPRSVHGIVGETDHFPVLVFPDYTRPFILEMDVSGVGLGAVLAQKQEDRKISSQLLLLAEHSVVRRKGMPVQRWKF